MRETDFLEKQMKTLRDLRSLTGMSRKAFSEYMGIPLRTLEEWEHGRRQMPSYVLRLIVYQIHMERFLVDNHIKTEDIWSDE